jgi:hypothetical protein
MKKSISILAILGILCYVAYHNKSFLAQKTNFLLHDPSEKVLNANTSEKDTIISFHHAVHGTIHLLVGTEKGYGLRHILARHTNKYFVNFDDKNKNTLFTDDVNGKEVISAMQEFYKHCVDIGIYNRRADRNIAYVGFVKIKGKDIKCLLIVRKLSKEIVTFYPFNEVREQEILRELEQERFHYD